MGFLNLSLYQHPAGLAFDPDKVIERVKAAFPEVTVLPGDQLAAEARRAEEFFGRELEDAPEGPARRVVESLRRKACAYGPAYAFHIPLAGGGQLKGVARGVNVQIAFDDPIPDEVRRRLLEFLRSLGVGRLEKSTAQGQSETVCELAGPSPYVRRQEIAG
jgi:hypothetical protein